MSSVARTLAAAALALLGTVAVYAGSLLNAAALGSTLGVAAILPGITFIAVATLPTKGLPLCPRRALLIGVLRYLSLPVFLLGAFSILLAGPSLFQINASKTGGLNSAAALTLAGFAAITWPEALALLRRMRGVHQS